MISTEVHLLKLALSIELAPVIVPVIISATIGSLGTIRHPDYFQYFLHKTIIEENWFTLCVHQSLIIKLIENTHQPKLLIYIYISFNHLSSKYYIYRIIILYNILVSVRLIITNKLHESGILENWMILQHVKYASYCNKYR